MTAQRQLELLASAPRYDYPHRAGVLEEVFAGAAERWHEARSTSGWEGGAADAARVAFARNRQGAEDVQRAIARSIRIVENANDAIDLAAQRFAALPSRDIPHDLIAAIARGAAVNVIGYGVLTDPLDVRAYARWLFQQCETAAQAALDEFRRAIDPLTEQLRDLTGTMAQVSVRLAAQHDDRPSLDDILSDYQVSDDPDGMTEWPAWPLSLATEPRTMTQTEADMLDRLGLYWLFQLNDIQNEAFTEADSRYVTDDRNDDHNDAFRHAYWNARMADLMGEDWAAEFATAHEGSPDNIYSAREAMDLYNNEVGRSIAVAHPDASPDELADLVSEAVEDGRLIVIDEDGNLRWSDQRPVGSPGDAGNGGGPLPGNEELDELRDDAGDSSWG
ncbi:DUF6973 domain-containing protein [Microbacterium gorillae]|uniref:DUF6973 domain-containing protein n=1 Tax=Microbacterium gorillae TaxID=1231063 RepID=UPI003D983436